MTEEKTKDYTRQIKNRLKFVEEAGLEQIEQVSDRLKSCWKPASSPEATIAIQTAFVEYPDLCDPKQLYYYVTVRDIEKAASMRRTNSRFDPEDYVGFVHFRTKIENDSAICVPKSELEEMGVKLPPWNSPGQSRIAANPSSRSRS